MSRVQLAINVDDLDAAIDFYSKLFATEPAKVRPGYANFAIAEPPLKLVLIENRARAAPSTTSAWRWPPPTRSSRPRPGWPARVWPRRRGRRVLLLRPAGQGVGGRPVGEPWEIYTVLADVEMPAASSAPSIRRPAPPAAATVDDDGAARPRHRRPLLLTRDA